MLTDTRRSCYFLSGNRTFSSNYIMNICQAPELFCVRQASILSKHHWHLESRCLFLYSQMILQFRVWLYRGPFLEISGPLSKF